MKKSFISIVALDLLGAVWVGTSWYTGKSSRTGIQDTLRTSKVEITRRSEPDNSSTC